jgi:RND family efflux transporter MFP subunit
MKGEPPVNRLKRLLQSILLAALVFSFGCGEEIEPGRVSESVPVVQGLTLAAVEEFPLGETHSLVGSVESSDRSLLAARIDGRVLSIKVRAGERVKANQLLLEIADNLAGSRLREAQSAVGEARQGLAAAEARLALAEQTWHRFRRLFDNRAVTPQEMDRVDAERELARRGRDGAVSSLGRAEAGLAAARTAAGYNAVRAPFASRVARKLVDEGVTVMPGTPLVELDRAGLRQVRAAVPEKFLGRLKVGDLVSVEVPALEQTFGARIAEMQPAADPASRTFLIKAVPEPPVDLEPGLFARVRLVSEPRPALLIPASAVAERGQLTGVFVLEGERLRWRLVRTGRQVGERIEILAGLHPGEQIVIDGIDRARDGSRVELQP